GPARAHGRVARARPRPEPRADRRRGAHRLARHRRDDEPRALEALPDGDDGGVAAPPPDALRLRIPRRRRVRLPGSAPGRRGPFRRVARAVDRRRPLLGTTDHRAGAAPDKHFSHTHDNRGRLQMPIKLCATGHRYSSGPASLMRRLVSNIEAMRVENGELVVESNFALAELAIQAKREMHSWVGHTTYRLRRVGGELRMCRKNVVLVNAA